MPWRDRLIPARMCRAVIAVPRSRQREVLVRVADLGLFQPDDPGSGSGREVGPAPALADEADLERRLATMVETDRCAVLPGWIPSRDLATLRAGVEPLGGALVELPLPSGVTPPSLMAPFAGRAGRVLVDTYSTVPYRDVDPTVFATIAYVVMFGMMFGDVGHGAMIAALALVARRVERPSLQALRKVWVIAFGAGVASMGFGLLYGEAFGPTGLVPVIWLEPLAEPDRLLVAGVILGAVLLAVTYVLGSIDRWREGGLAKALYSASGLAGALTFAGVAALAGGLAVGSPLAWQVGLALIGLGLLLAVVGMVAELGHSAGALLQAGIEVFDVMLRLGSNLVSFARLAAFGLTHAAISKVVWDATVSSWGGLVGSLLAVVVFVVGNALAFALEALVAGIQALRLEYYELFSRLFLSEGRPFQPWHIPTRPLSEDS